VQRGAPADGLDAKGRTPLMHALERRRAECVLALLPSVTRRVP